MSIQIDGIYIPSNDLVARVIEDELIIVPLAAGIGDMEDELYTLNETGRAIWQRLDGRRSLQTIAGELADEFDAPASEIEQDVYSLLGELLHRRIVVEVEPGAG